MSDAARDLKVALAMNGGVSLAVWIGGVSSEFYRASRREGLYGALSSFTDTDVVIDVLTGASAGGLNGVFLAAAISRDLPSSNFDDLRDVWLSVGSFDNLLRDPAQKNPPSVLRGDEVFLREAERVLRSWMARPAVKAPPGRSDVELVMTATTLDPVPTGATDDEGNRIVDPRHRARFTFTGATLRTADPALTARQLARAARTSASFPGAFEPSFVAVGNAAGSAAPSDAGSTDPDMRGIASFDQSMWAVDGGVLVNKPVGPALEVIARHRSNRPGDRVLVYVNPDPGTRASTPPATRATPPTIGAVVSKSLFSLPRAESLAEELATIDDYRRRYGLRRRLRESLLLGIATGAGSEEHLDITATAAAVYPIWLRRDGIASADAAVAAHLRRIGSTFDRPVSASRSRNWTSVANAIRLARGHADVLAGSFPAPGTSLAAWRYGPRSVDAAAVTVTDLVQRALDLAPSGHPGEPALLDARQSLDGVRDELAARIDSDARAWETALAAGVPSGDLAEWASAPFGTAATRAAAEVRLGELMASVTTTLSTVAPTLRTVADAAAARDAAGVTNPPSRVLRRLVASVGTGNPDATDDVAFDSASALARRLLGLFVLQDLSDDEPVERPDLRFVQVSADTVCPVDPGRTAAEKVRGLSLGHFGGFLKSSWRANDWMWGRFDGAAQLAELLVTPDRLRRRYPSKADCLAGLATMFASQPELAIDAGAITAAVGDELDFLDVANGQRPPQQVPRTVALIGGALVRLAAADELAVVADAIQRSKTEGARATPDALEFARQVGAVRQPSGRVPLAATERLVRACRVGGETLGEEVGSDALSHTALGVAAVASGALAGTSNGIRPVRAAFAVVRRALSWIYVLAESMLRGTRTATGVLMSLLGVGGTLVAARLLGAKVPTGPLVVGIYLLAGFVALVALIVGWKRSAASVGVALVVVLLATIDRSDARTLFFHPSTPTWKPVLHFGGAALLVGAFALAGRRAGPRRKAMMTTGVGAAAVWLVVGFVVRYLLQTQRAVDVAGWIHDWRAVLIAVAIPAGVAVASVGSRLWR